MALIRDSGSRRLTIDNDMRDMLEGGMDTCSTNALPKAGADPAQRQMRRPFLRRTQWLDADECLDVCHESIILLTMLL